MKRLFSYIIIRIMVALGINLSGLLALVVGLFGIGFGLKAMFDPGSFRAGSGISSFFPAHKSDESIRAFATVLLVIGTLGFGWMFFDMGVISGGAGHVDELIERARETGPPGLQFARSGRTITVSYPDGQVEEFEVEGRISKDEIDSEAEYLVEISILTYEGESNLYAQPSHDDVAVAANPVPISNGLLSAAPVPPVSEPVSSEPEAVPAAIPVDQNQKIAEVDRLVAQASTHWRSQEIIQALDCARNAGRICREIYGMEHEKTQQILAMVRAAEGQLAGAAGGP